MASLIRPGLMCNDLAQAITPVYGRINAPVEESNTNTIAV